MALGAKTLGGIAMVAASMLLACSPASASSSCPSQGVQVVGLSQAAMESSIECLINEERSAFGAPPVQPSPELREAALSHSDEMVRLGYFEHTSPAGLSFVQRIQDTGYTQGARYWEVGENLVWGTGALSTPRSLVTSWMNSPPHRENLLHARFREIGIGAVVGTPENSRDLLGVTVSSEYGYRSYAKAKNSAKAKRKRRHRRRAHRAHRRR